MKTFLLLSVMAASSLMVAAQGALPKGVEKKSTASSMTHQSVRMEKRQAGDVTTPQPNQATNAKLQYQRPVGQFYFSPYPVGESEYWFPGGGMVVTPFASHTFNNLSSMPNPDNYQWEYEIYDPANEEADEYGWVPATSKDENFTTDFIRGSYNPIVLKYGSNFTFGDKSYRYSNGSYSEYDLQFFSVKNVGDYIAELNERGQLTNFEGCLFPVSSKYFGGGTRMRNQDSNAGFMRITGSDEETGREWNWWGNGSEYSATGTRFEKPDAPYLLKGVYIYGFWYTTAEVKFPVKVYKVVENAYSETNEEGQRSAVPAVLGELIIEGEATVISGASEDNPYEGYLECKFTETDETGATYVVEPEISDDIVVVVENINDPAIKFGSLLISWDKYDEGYGNIGYLGRQASENDTEDTPILYGLLDIFQTSMPSAPTVFIDAARGWIINASENATDEWNVPVEGEQGKQIFLFASEPSEDGMNWEPTLENGDALPDWLEINMQDDYEEDSFSGYVTVELNAEALPQGVTGREAIVKFSFPTASYLYTVKQGDNGAVEVVGVNGEIISNQYFDLQGREVKNVPENGIFIQKSVLSDGSVKSVKVIR